MLDQKQHPNTRRFTQSLTHASLSCAVSILIEEIVESGSSGFKIHIFGWCAHCLSVCHFLSGVPKHVSEPSQNIGPCSLLCYTSVAIGLSGEFYLRLAYLAGRM